jgi:phosphoenolpyruvate-protein phosphotransferase
MARDPELLSLAASAMDSQQIDSIGAVMSAATVIAERLRSLDNEMFRARATDVIDVGDRVARILAGLPTRISLREPSIAVGEDISPSVAATLPRELLLGIALEGSSPTAHAAILARAYGIPAVVGARGLLAALRAAGANAEIAIDGASGEILIAPDVAGRARFDREAATATAMQARDLAEAGQPATTVDGTEVELLANIGSPAEAQPAATRGARGVGLFRTEFLFLERPQPPSEDEQCAAYRKVLETFPGSPVTVRLLDAGGDKPIPYLDQPHEDNPFLGVRALRLAEHDPDLFVTQLRACYRASTAGTVRVMAPMVADATDVQAFLALADRARDELRHEDTEIGAVELGVMLEIPSAILTAGSYFDRIAFASIGTNDLLQYTLAADRGNAALERYRDSLHPALLRLVRAAVVEADRAGISISVCGEMAGEPTAALALVGLGVRSLSMTAASLAAVRRVIRAADIDQLGAQATAALDDASAAEVRARFA